MRPIWRFLEVDNHQAISDQVYEYIINHTDILNPKHQPVFYTDVVVPHILKHSPLLRDFLDQRFLVPSYISIVVVPAYEVPYIHVDYSDPYVRLLWPVKNCAGSRTKMYDIPKEFLVLNSDPIASTNTYYDITEERDWPVLAEIELLQPVVLDVSVAHAVHPAPDATGHRVSFTIGFDKDLPISKSVKAWFGFQR
jgi:hypothetical protein